MNYIHRVFLYGSLILFMACKGDIACQSPPETLRLILRTADGKDLVSAANAEQVAIRYFRNGQLTAVNDLRVQPPALESLDMLNTARQNADTTRFYVLINDKPQGMIQLKTYVDARPCQGWVRAQELRFDGHIIPYDNTKPGYTLTVAP